jgi:hypothetical protein
VLYAGTTRNEIGETRRSSSLASCPFFYPSFSLFPG